MGHREGRIPGIDREFSGAFPGSGPRLISDELLSEILLDPEKMATKIRERIKKKKRRINSNPHKSVNK